jgi:regulator of replication initiation timing
MPEKKSITLLIKLQVSKKQGLKTVDKRGINNIAEIFHEGFHVHLITKPSTIYENSGLIMV